MMIRWRFSTAVIILAQALALVCAAGVATAAYKGRLVWEPSPGAVDGYRVYYTPVPMDVKMLDVGPSLECPLELLDLYPGTTYYFAVTAYLGNQESDLSEIISAFFPDIGSGPPVTTTTTTPPATTTTTAPPTTTTTTTPPATTTTTAPPTTTTTIPYAGGGGATSTTPVPDIRLPRTIYIDAAAEAGAILLQTDKYNAYWQAGSIRYTSGSDWITGIDPQSGVARYNEPSEVTVLVARDGLAAGKYRAVIPFSSSGATVSITVIMTVPEQPEPEPEPECYGDSDCDDGFFCNGPGLCRDGVCVATEPPCEDGQICLEEEQVCAEMRLSEATAVPPHLSRPHARDTFTRMVMLRSDAPVYCGKAPYSVSIDGPDQFAHGVDAGPLYAFGRFVFVLVTVEREATSGTWRMRIETPLPDEDVPFVEVLESDIVVQ